MMARRTSVDSEMTKSSAGSKSTVDSANRYYSEWKDQMQPWEGINQVKPEEKGWETTQEEPNPETEVEYHEWWLYKIFLCLEGSVQDTVKRQDLLSISTKISDDEIMREIRSNEWLGDLLKPEQWGRSLLKLETGGTMNFKSFFEFWCKYQNDIQANGYERRDTLGSILSARTKSSSVRDVFPERKILRALSVRSDTKETSSKRISVSSSVRGVKKDPVLVTVKSDWAAFLSQCCQALDIELEKGIILIHKELNARVVRLDDLENGDHMELSVESPLQIQVPLKSPREVCVSNPVMNFKVVPNNEEDEKNILSPFASFARRKSWREVFDVKPLSRPVRRTLCQLLEKLSITSSRWQKRAEGNRQEISETMLLENFDALQYSSSISIDQLFQIIEKLKLSFGMGRSQLRVLFDAIDQDNTGRISRSHCRDMLCIWRDEWTKPVRHVYTGRQVQRTALPDLRQQSTACRPKSAHPQNRNNEDSKDQAKPIIRHTSARPRLNRDKKEEKNIETKTPVRSSNKVVCNTEEEYLRALHDIQTVDPLLFLGYASLILDNCKASSTLSYSKSGSYWPSLNSNKTQETKIQDERIEKARNLLESALSERSCTDSSRAEILCKLAEIAVTKSDFTAAKTIFHQAIQKHPTSSNVLTKYGTFLHKLRDRNGAREYYLQALVHDKSSIDALLGYAVLLAGSEDEKDCKAAAEYFDRARLVARNSNAPKDVRSKVLVQVGIYQNSVQEFHHEALQSFQRASQLDPLYVDAAFELGRLQFAVKKDMEQAVKAFDRALSANPSHFPSMVALAQLLSNSSNQEDIKRADILFSKASMIEPENFTLVLSYAEYCAKVAKSEIKAESLYEKAFGMATTDLQRKISFERFADFNEMKARNSIKQSCRKTALNYYCKAARISIDVGLIHSLGKCAIECKEYDTARKHLLLALKEAPGNTDTKWILAIVEANLGNRSEASKLFRIAYEEDPKNDFVLVHFARFLLDFNGTSSIEKTEGIAENMLRVVLKKNKLEDSKRRDVHYYSSAWCIGMTTLGFLLCNNNKKSGIELIRRVSSMCPQACEPKIFLARALAMDFRNTKQLLYCENGDEHWNSIKDNLEKLDSSIVLLEQVMDGSEVTIHLELASLLSCRSKLWDALQLQKQYLLKSLHICKKGIKNGLKSKESENKMGTKKLGDLYFLTGYLYTQLGNHIEATNNFRESIGYNPRLVLSLYHIAERLEVDDLEGAQKLYIRALEQQPETHAEAEDHRILCHLLLRAYDIAESNFMEDDTPDDDFQARALVMHQFIAKTVQNLNSE